MNYKNYQDNGLTRSEAIALYIINSKDTVRGAAKIFNISKSTVHKDLTTKLKAENLTLYKKVNIVLQKNKSERHIRGGLATQKKYRAQRNEKPA